MPKERARQYGKTTTLNALKHELEGDYLVLSLSFEGMTSANFATEQNFVAINKESIKCRLFCTIEAPLFIGLDILICKKYKIFKGYTE